METKNPMKIRKGSTDYKRDFHTSDTSRYPLATNHLLVDQQQNSRNFMILF